MYTLINTLYHKYSEKIKAIFFDQVFLVGSGMFCNFSVTLQKIMETKDVFGGISLITRLEIFFS